MRLLPFVLILASCTATPSQTTTVIVNGDGDGESGAGGGSSPLLECVALPCYALDVAPGECLYEPIAGCRLCTDDGDCDGSVCLDGACEPLVCMPSYLCDDCRECTTDHEGPLVCFYEFAPMDGMTCGNGGTCVSGDCVP